MAIEENMGINPDSYYDDEAQIRSDVFLHNNGYPGRWLAIGRMSDRYGDGDNFAMAYSFGGRSDPSKNRVVMPDGSAMRLVAPGMTPEQMSEVSDAALIYYPSSDTREGVFVVSNGAQTTYVLDALVEGASFQVAVSEAPTVRGVIDGEEQDIDLSSYEPDLQITPRITGFVDLREGATTSVGLAVVRKQPESAEPIRSFYTARLEDIDTGEGWAIQTYGVNDPSDRETPVPPFDKKPYPFDFQGHPEDIASSVRIAIGEETFAAAVVRVIDTNLREFRGNAIINTRG